MRRRLGLLSLLLVGAAVGPALAQAPAPKPASGAPPASIAAAPSLEVARVVFRGNRKVEDDALRVNLRTVPGSVLTQDMPRGDVRTIWRMGFFEDVQVETVNVNGGTGGLVVTFVLKEKPSIRKIYVT